MGMVTRSYVTTPSEFFINCNGAIYPLYAEPAEIPAQTVTLTPGRPQLARANEELLGPLVEEERAVSVTLAMLQDRVPASFTEIAPRSGTLPDRKSVVKGKSVSVRVDLGGARYDKKKTRNHQ